MHQARFIGIFGDSHRNIEGVGAIIDLLASNFENRIPVFGEQETLKFTAALRITTLADDEWGRFLTHRK